MGLRPYDYNIEKDKITNSKLNSVLAVLFCITFSYLYHLSIEPFVRMLTSISIKQTTLTLQSTYAIFYGTISTFVGIYLFQNIFKSKLLILLLNAQKFHKKTKYIFKDNEIMYKKSLIIFCAKSLFFKLIMIGATVFSLKEGSKASIYAIFITLPGLFIFSVSNLFYGSIFGIKYYFEALNNKIEIILLKIKFIGKPNNYTLYEKTKTYCDLSDQIDEIAILHSELSYITRDFANIYHIQILLIFVNTFICVILQVMRL